MDRRVWIGIVVLSLVTSARVQAQPTYPLKVREEWKPEAVLRFEGRTVVRSAIRHDPGFDVVFHVQRAGKTVARIKARTANRHTLSDKEPGEYTVVLEQFFPGYKATSTETKGAYRPISNVVRLILPLAGARKFPAGNPPEAAKAEPPAKK